MLFILYQKWDTKWFILQHQKSLNLLTSELFDLLWILDLPIIFFITQHQHHSSLNNIKSSSSCHQRNIYPRSEVSNHFTGKNTGPRLVKITVYDNYFSIHQITANQRIKELNHIKLYNSSNLTRLSSLWVLLELLLVFPHPTTFINFNLKCQVFLLVSVAVSTAWVTIHQQQQQHMVDVAKILHK